MSKKIYGTTITVRLLSEQSQAIRKSGIPISDFIRQAINLKLQTLEA